MNSDLASQLSNLKEIVRENISTKSFFESNKNRVKLSSANGLEHLERNIVEKNLHRPGLALAGYVELFTYHRVQVFGNTEINYIRSLSAEDQVASFAKLMNFEIPCMVITNGLSLPDKLLDMATEHQVPIFVSEFETTKVVFIVSDFLDDQFAPQSVIHGSFLDVYGVGLLFVGRSGIGKSEIALDLVERGHRLVADDVIMVTQKAEGILMGSGTDLVKHFMEVRGLGLIDIRSMFGIRAIRFQKRVEVIVQLEEWSSGKEYTRTGLDSTALDVLGVEVPHVVLPIFPGKNVTVISEVIALNYLLRHYGYDAALEFSNRLQEKLDRKSENNKTERVVDWFEHDFE